MKKQDFSLFLTYIEIQSNKINIAVKKIQLRKVGWETEWQQMLNRRKVELNISII